MAILNQKRILNLIPKTSAPVTIHVSQGDVGTEIEFTLVKGDELFVNTGSLSASVHGVREDGANFGVFTCTLSGSSVKFPLHAEMTAVKGSAIAEIVLVDSQGNKVGSSNFGIMVEESVFPLGVTYDNDVSVYESILAYVQTIPAQVEANFNTAIETLTNSLGNEISERQLADSFEASERASADSNLQMQINEFVHPSGEAPNPTEIVNARVGTDNATYDTLGNAIRAQFTDVNNEAAFVRNDYYKFGGMPSSVTTGFHIKSDGTREDAATYKLVKYPVIEGKLYKIVNNDNWQFQSNAQVTTAGTYRVGVTYNGNGYAIAPPTATYLILTCLTSYEPYVYELFEENIDEIQLLNDEVYTKIELLPNRSNTISGFKIKYDGLRVTTDANDTIYKYNIEAGKLYHVDCLGYWQFQNTASASDVLPGSRIGHTYKDSGYAIAPTTATWLLVSAPTATPPTVSVIDYTAKKEISALNDSEQINLNKSYLWEPGNITSDGENGAPSSVTYPYRIRTRGFISENITHMHKHKSVYVFRYTTLGVFVDLITNVTDIYVFDHANYKYRVSILGDDNDVSNYVWVDFYGKKGKFRYVPMCHFKYPDTITPISSSVLDNFDFEVQSDGYVHILEDIYDAFDSFVNDYPNIVSKSDAALLLGLTYPTYANGGDGTPTYKTYMYTISTTNEAAGNLGNTKKKKLLILGGVHGNELAAPVNTYLFIKSILEMSNSDMFSLLSCFDIYVIPCVNGWGMYNLQRINGNGVNINRNFPVAQWKLEGSPGDSNYTGAVAGDQFETQLVMGITDYIKADMCVDHHNYGVGNDRQFYVETSYTEMCNGCYQALQDCAYAFLKNMPSYFGTEYSLLMNIPSAPAVLSYSHEGKTQSWWYEHGIDLAAIIEIGASINYYGCDHKELGRDLYGSDTFGVGLFTLQNVLCHFAEYLLMNK